MALYHYNFYYKKASLLACLFLWTVLTGYTQQFITFTKTEQQNYLAFGEMDHTYLRRTTDHDSPASIYIANLHHSIELILSNDPQQFERYQEAQEARLEILEESNITDPIYSFIKAELLLQSAFVHLKFGYELESAWSIRQSLRLIKKKKNNFPDYLPYLKTWGLLQVLMGSVPEDYHWLLSVLGMKGSIDEGLSALSIHAASADATASESAMLLSLFQAYLLGRSSNISNKAEKSVSALQHFVNLLVALKSNSGPKAIESYNTLKQCKWDYPVTYYLAGEAYLRQGDFVNAVKQYQHFIEQAKGEANVKDAHYKIFLAYHLSGSASNAQKYYLLAKEKGNTQTEADKHANKSLKKDKWPNVLIMRIRLLTDGGYYSVADSLLETEKHHQFNDSEEQLEFTYRKARLAHQQGKISKAIEFYEKVTATTFKTASYYAPNSCLQLGLIYAELGQTKKAKAYLTKVSGYPKHEYKRSLDQKAKNALAKL
ncbi:tetratricopeptide repeat protein [Fulvivirga sp. M361]|uniref:tetratricopeptide repeat protein n=1 Tax=Fulvivirga sp. M361 TaxID=2594266 RepID=UPI00117BCEC4|nr:tetratricopeptide repeat protein [Fulvivirga sp. M361]TRX49488.1 tetratricopeptide repeat protein [Fulvivirga sp. M361]